MMMQKRKIAEVAGVEDEEAKKRQKKEQAQAFFEKARAKKEAQKKERQEAIARGEAVPEKAAPPPLKEAPTLAPQIKAFCAAALDPSVSGDSLSGMFARIMGVRHEIASVATELGQREDATMQMRRKALIKTLVDRLRCVEDQTLPVNVLSADPMISVLKKGVTTSILKFASGYPELQVVEQPNAKGVSIQYLKLEGSGPKGTGAFIDSSVGAEMLLGQIIADLQAAGGSTTVSALHQDPVVRQRMTGVTAKLQKWLANYDNMLSVEPTPDGKDMVCTLKASEGEMGLNQPKAIQFPPQFPAAAAAVAALMGDPKDNLVETIVSYLQAHGGTASVGDLGGEPTIKERSKGVAAKLSKFLGQYPTHFSLTTDAKQNLMCSLVGM